MTSAELIGLLVALAAIATAAGIPIGWILNARRQNGAQGDTQRTLVRMETRLALLPTRDDLDRAERSRETDQLLAVIELLRADLLEAKKAGHL